MIRILGNLISINSEIFKSIKNVEWLAITYTSPEKYGMRRTTTISLKRQPGNVFMTVVQMKMYLW